MRNQLGFIWLAGVRDLQWRRRRFVMAIVATALVFAITLLLAGFSESFGVEANRLVDEIGVDGYVVQEETKGPFMSPRPFPADTIEEIAQISGLTSARPLIAIVQPDMYLLGFGSGPVSADKRLNLEPGDPVRIGATTLTVAEVTKGNTVLGGQPVVTIPIRDAYKALFAGNSFVTSVAVNGAPTEALPDGFVYVSRSAAVDDLLRPLGVVRNTIRLVSLLLWFAAAAIVGSVVYISTLERTRDLAVFKATGAATGDLLTALILQAVLTAVGASVAAIGLAYALAPAFPAAVSFPFRLLVLLPTVAVVIGLLASGAGLRRAARVDPALAMGAAG
jgi:putative ABC transport system permease protein